VVWPEDALGAYQIDGTSFSEIVVVRVTR